MDKISTLLIEDNPADARIVKEFLAEEYPDKYVIDIVDRLTDAEKALVEKKYHIVLTDLGLPDSDGLNTVRRIQEINEELPVIVLTGREDEELGREIVQSGAQDYIVKGKGDGYLINRAIQYAIERKRIQLKLSHLAFYDNLTGLPNRALFRERLDRAIARAQRKSVIGALLLLDLDGFKEVNDTLGHDMGDQLLINVSEKLKACVRETDSVARLGGDEFTIVLEELKETGDASIIAEKFLGLMATPTIVDGKELAVTASIGISIFPMDDVSPVNLLKYADIAMYRAKAAGKNRVEYYREDDAEQRPD